MNGDRWDWSRRAAVVVAFLIAGLWLWGNQRDRSELANKLEESTERIDELGSAVATMQGQVDVLGGEPAIELDRDEVGPLPVEVTGPRGERGPPPSDEQVAAAVEQYCATNGCTGPAPSPLEVAAAVASYCDARGECVGPAGEQGQSGEQGPGPSDAQIASAVGSYCAAHGNCAGPAGADGQPGADGERGEPGPTCPDGTDPVTWTVDPPQSALTGLDPGTYLICRTAA